MNFDDALAAVYGPQIEKTVNGVLNGENRCVLGLNCCAREFVFQRAVEKLRLCADVQVLESRIPFSTPDEAEDPRCLVVDSWLSQLESDRCGAVERFQDKIKLLQVEIAKACRKNKRVILCLREFGNVRHIEHGRTEGFLCSLLKINEYSEAGCPRLILESSRALSFLESICPQLYPTTPFSRMFPSRNRVWVRPLTHEQIESLFQKVESECTKPCVEDAFNSTLGSAGLLRRIVDRAPKEEVLEGVREFVESTRRILIDFPFDNADHNSNKSLYDALLALASGKRVSEYARDAFRKYGLLSSDAESLPGAWTKELLNSGKVCDPDLDVTESSLQPQDPMPGDQFAGRGRDAKKAKAILSRAMICTSANEENIKKRVVMDVKTLFGPNKTAILLIGEPGVGKSYFAKKIASWLGLGYEKIEVSAMSKGPGVLQDELYGHTKCAYGKQLPAKDGLLKNCNEKVVFFDEVGDIGVEDLRSLRDVFYNRSFRPVGGGVETVEFVLILATNKDLIKAVDEGDFPLDVLERIARLVIEIPPLDRRRQEILSIVRKELTTFKGVDGDLKIHVDDSVYDYLRAFAEDPNKSSWPANMRSVVEHFVPKLIRAANENGLHLDLVSVEKVCAEYRAECAVESNGENTGILTLDTIGESFIKSLGSGAKYPLEFEALVRILMNNPKTTKVSCVEEIKREEIKRSKGSKDKVDTLMDGILRGTNMSFKDLRKKVETYLEKRHAEKRH